MANKKSDKSEPPAEATLLEKRVDKMMDTKQASQLDAASSDVSAVAASVNQSLSENMDGHSINVRVKSQQSAPELPKDMQAGDEPLATEKTTEKPAEAPGLPELETEAEPATEMPTEDPLEDSATDKAVDEIAANESDMVLAVEDAKAARNSKAVKSGGGWKSKLRSFFRNKWTWIIAGLLLVAILALPMTRYKVLGLAIKKTVTVKVIDSKNSTPVSNAQIELAGASAKTDANGEAKLKASVGKQNLSVSKKYYIDLNTTYFVGFKSSKASPVKVVATGRLVPITVLNKITGKPVSGVQVKALGTTAKTNAKGLAIIALPTKTDTNPGKLSLSGYNNADVTVQVTDKTVKANTFEITPAGQVYFLSNRNGTLDVVKSNLDGSGRKTILEGTGKEDRNTTSLLASRDWRYLVLKSRRDGALASLYLIDTSTDKVSQFDNGDAEFNLIGWYDHSFIYSLTRNGTAVSQSGKQLIKSYDADHLQLNQLDQTAAEGTAASYAYQNFSGFYIVKGALAYSVQWNSYDNYDLAGKNSAIRAVQPNGQNKKDYQSFPATTTGYINASLYEPEGIYYSVYDNAANKTSFYVFENLAVKTASIDQATFDQSYPTFLLSPSGKQTFWTELRDGKNALFTGDATAENKKQVATLSDYSPYGWYSDDYVLVSKNSSELYITSPEVLKAGTKPFKVTDYYKPAQTYQGYGYGYGGL